MFIVITGLDGSGTTSIGQGLHNLDPDSYLLKTPSEEFIGREIIDTKIREQSKIANMLYYLSSTVYMSDYIQNNCDYQRKNVYLIRYLIDTVVSNRVAGIDINMDYNIYGHQLLIPDLTIFISLDEKIRQERISKRGKSNLDRVLDIEENRIMFYEEFKRNLPKNTIYVSNDSENIDETTNKLYKKIKKITINKK